MNNLNGKQEICQKVNLFLDNQLNTEDQQDFKSKMENNPDYSQIYQQVQFFRTLIKEKADRHNVTNDLKSLILQKLKS